MNKMMKSNWLVLGILYFLVITSTLSLSSCGGGGGGGGAIGGANKPPVANAGENQHVMVGSLVTLDGSGSSDANKNPLTYSWSFVAKPSGSTASLVNPTVVNPMFGPDVAGTYIISLVVNDGKADSTADSVTFTAVTPSPGILKMPDTNQTASYTTTFGEDNDYTINPPSYADDGDTIFDNVTTLTWQKQDDGVEKVMSAAITYCANLTLGGQTDWRLPNRIELASLIDNGTYAPAINTTYFPNTLFLLASHYWSSTPDLDSPGGDYWLVDFNTGYSVRTHDSDNYVRCVRGGQATPRSLTDNGNGTVTDRGTLLMWQQGESSLMDWEAALITCETSTLAGSTDWRLPNHKELLSLVDDTRYIPAINTTMFPAATSSGYWSSTTNPKYTAGALTVDFKNGVSGYGDKTSTSYARCVRGGQ